MGLRHQATSAVLWSAVANVGGQAIFLVVFLILARLLGPADFGLVAYAAIFSSFFGLFLQLGYSDAIVQFQTIDEDHLATAFWTCLSIGVAMTIGCCLAAYPIGLVLGRQDLVAIIQALSPCCLFAGLRSVPEGLLLREMRFKAIAGRTLTANFFSGAVGVSLAFAGYGAWALVGQRLVAEGLLVGLTWIAVRFWPRRTFCMSRFKQLTRYSARVFGINVVNYTDQYVDQLLVGVYLSEVKLGIYSVGRRLFRTASTVLLDTFRTVSFSALSKVQEDSKRIGRAICEGTSTSTALTYPVFLSGAVFCLPIVEALLKEQWIPVASLLWAFCLLGIYSSTMVMFIGACKATGNPSYVLYQRIISVTTNIVLFIIVVRYGLFWIATSYAIKAYLLFPFQMWLLSKATGVSTGEFLRSIIRPLAISVTAVSIGAIVFHNLPETTPTLARLLASSVVIAAIQAAGIWRFLPFAREALQPLFKRVFLK